MVSELATSPSFEIESESGYCPLLIPAKLSTFAPSAFAACPWTEMGRTDDTHSRSARFLVRVVDGPRRQEGGNGAMPRASSESGALAAKASVRRDRLEVPHQVK